LKWNSYSLQANRKTREGSSHADRNDQFEYINRQVRGFHRRSQPVISVDTKKKEFVGEFKNPGEEWQPKGQPEMNLAFESWRRLSLTSVDSPSALGPVAVDPNREVDRLSASYLIALGARVVREVGDLVRRAKEAGKRLATLAVNTQVRFRSATDRAAFSSELTEAITKLVSKYHDESAAGGRAHRLVVVAHPLPLKSEAKEPS
jgi:hypothetical protein